MKVKWDKADLLKYTEIINEGLITSLQDINTKDDIETGFHDITAVITKATNEIAQKPKIRKNKPKLKVMSDEILKAIRNKKSAFYYWKANGRPTDCLDPFLLEKKITTQELRKTCRLEVAQERMQERNEIIEASSSNKTLFYKLINKQRGKLSRRIDELNVGDNIYNTPEQIMEGWKIHFGQLAENTLDENFDSNYLKNTENEYKNIIELCSEQFIHVNRNLELEQTVKTLFTRIETLEAYKTTQGNGGTIHSIPNTEDKVSHDSTSSDKLIVGIRDKVTNYVLGKVDEELNKLLNNSCNRSSNSEQFNSSQQSYDQQKSFVQPHQYSPNQHSIPNQPYVTTQRPNHQYPYYGQPVFHNTSHLQPSHQCSNAYYQFISHFGIFTV
ncbi:unnamed protein product [Mytilus edulis]|uniref:Uncharacterized protein n=1 Tax=Mytilus edulis TaxID=6550 RepID=A0A8S3VB56_MYTED|nr:unnamed protein product [Mytilus edulis]